MKTLMVSREAGLQNRQWYVVDATNVVLGRLATRVATILRGKHKATFTPHEDTGDFVVIINAEQVRLTGNKLQDKVYRRHTGYPGGVRARTAAEQMTKDPTKILRDAIEGMLPKNRLGRQLATKLKVYRDGQHPHSAQQPIELRLNDATTGA